MEPRTAIVGGVSAGIIGYSVSVAALNVPNKNVAHMIKSLLDKTLEITDRNISWAQISVQMVTDLILNAPTLANGLVDAHHFCPVSPQEALKAISPMHAEDMKKLTADSYVYHFWNEIMRRSGINCDVMPPQGSFLHSKFSLLV
jgi:hypothetical protein